MKTLDHDGYTLCVLQAQVFEYSVDQVESSSPIFIRRFMKSQIVKRLDDASILDTNLQAKDLIDEVLEEYGVSCYGSTKYTRNEMYWIGYVYRYFALAYERSSSQIYRLVKPKELREVFLPYHTMDPAQALERILEAKGICLEQNEEQELKRQYAIYRRIRHAEEKSVAETRTSYYCR